MTNIPFTRAAAELAKPAPVAVINWIGVMEMKPQLQSEFINVVVQAIASGVRPVLSIRDDHTDAMVLMTQLKLRQLVPDEKVRSAFYYGDRVLFSHDEIALGESGVMQKGRADIYIAPDIYARGVPYETYIDARAEDIVAQAVRAFSSSRSATPPGFLHGPIPLGR